MDNRIDSIVVSNMYMWTLGALCWDMLVSIPEDIAFVRRGFSLVTFAYSISRASALGYVLLSAISNTSPVSNCVALQHGTTSCWVIATAASSFLFLRRVQALYANNKLVYYVFFILYIANVGVSTVVPIGSRVVPLGHSGFCRIVKVENYVAAAAFMPLAFDSLVFFAITYRIATQHVWPGNRPTWKVWITGNALPRLSKAVLQGGQQYFLFTVGANILISVLIVAPAVPPVFRAAFTIPDMALTSSMACRIHRNLKLANERSEPTEGRISTIQFQTRERVPVTSGHNLTTHNSDSTKAPSSGIPVPTLHVVDIERGGCEDAEIVFK